MMGPVIVLGDFSAHLDEGRQNLQGALLQEVMVGRELCAVSQGMLASGPAYTYCSGQQQ